MLATDAEPRQRPPGLAETTASASWASTRASWSVIISSYRRPGFLPELLASLEAVAPPPGDFELVVIDNGSGDDTWPTLRRLIAATSLAAIAGRVERNEGPGPGRNAAVTLSRGQWLAFTDDDCLPTPGWLTGLAGAIADAPAVQGRVRPVAGPHGPWDRTLDVGGATPLFETANMAYRRDVFEAAGGFSGGLTLAGRGGLSRPFGEDVLLGDRVVRVAGRPAWAADAAVTHRWLPGTFSGHLREQRTLSHFPLLAGASATLGDALWHRVFLNSSTARFDLALAGVALAGVRRSPLPLALALPWAARRWPEARHKTGRVSRLRALATLGGLLAGEVVGLASLSAGSIRARRLVV